MLITKINLQTPSGNISTIQKKGSFGTLFSSLLLFFRISQVRVLEPLPPYQSNSTDRNHHKEEDDSYAQPNETASNAHQSSLLITPMKIVSHVKPKILIIGRAVQLRTFGHLTPPLKVPGGELHGGGGGVTYGRTFIICDNYYVFTFFFYNMDDDRTSSEPILKGRKVKDK